MALKFVRESQAIFERAGIKDEARETWIYTPTWSCSPLVKLHAVTSEKVRG